MKKSIFFSIIILILTAISGFSQDTIRMKDRSIIKCKITKVTPDRVFYQTLGNTNSKEVIVLKQDIKKLRFEHGTKTYELYEDNSIIGKTIETKNTFYGPSLYIEDKKLSSFELKSLLYHHPNIFNKYQNGKTIQILGIIITVPTAIATAGSIIFFTTSNDVNMTTLAISTAGLLIGITATYRGKSMMKKAINQYNGEISEPVKLSLNFGIQNHGIGIGLNF